MPGTRRELRPQLLDDLVGGQLALVARLQVDVEASAAAADVRR